MPAPWLSWTRTLSCKSDAKDVVVAVDHPKAQQRFSHSAVASSKIQPAPAASPLPFPIKKVPKQQQPAAVHVAAAASSMIRSSCNCSLANLRDVVHGNTRVVHRASTSSGSPRSSRALDSAADFLPEVSQDALFLESADSPTAGHGQHLDQAPLIGRSGSGSSSSLGHPNHHPQQQQHVVKRKFGGGGGSCNGCSVLETMDSMISYKDSSAAMLARNCNLPQLSCQKCGDCFSRIDALEHHHTIQHAVSELGRGDSSRNIIEIIFRSSWIVGGGTAGGGGVGIGRIERVLKVNNSQRTIARFEDYRDAVKSRANAAAMAARSRNARCVADGNELLRFFGSSVACSLGAHGSTSVCSLPHCAICRIIRQGFTLKNNNRGIQTTATSSNAHSEENFCVGGRQRAMIVCRVIAGRSFRNSSACSSSSGSSSSGAPELSGGPPNGYDSVVTGIGSDGGNLIVFNPRAVLPCFVVIYKC